MFQKQLVCEVNRIRMKVRTKYYLYSTVGEVVPISVEFLEVVSVQETEDRLTSKPQAH